MVKFVFYYILNELRIESLAAAFLVNFSVGLVLGFIAGFGKFRLVEDGSGINDFQIMSREKYYFTPFFVCRFR